PAEYPELASCPRHQRRAHEDIAGTDFHFEAPGSIWGLHELYAGVVAIRNHSAAQHLWPAIC
ncbi:MAG TPA: hypothetical protein PLM62_07075, partial [Zoogloea sp.]|nr:hypothetical protein [Zoogloea sp.]